MTHVFIFWIGSVSYAQCNSRHHHTRKQMSRFSASQCSNWPFCVVIQDDNLNFQILLFFEILLKVHSIVLNRN